VGPLFDIFSYLAIESLPPVKTLLNSHLPWVAYKGAHWWHLLQAIAKNKHMEGEWSGVCFEWKLANKPKATGEPSSYHFTTMHLWFLVNIYTRPWMPKALLWSLRIHSSSNTMKSVTSESSGAVQRRQGVLWNLMSWRTRDPASSQQKVTCCKEFVCCLICSLLWFCFIIWIEEVAVVW
jgi:hypothetical protein